jgi:hypothetical protein
MTDAKTPPMEGTMTDAKRLPVIYAHISGDGSRLLDARLESPVSHQGLGGSEVVEYLPRVACKTCEYFRPERAASNRCNLMNGLAAPKPDGSSFCSFHPALAHLIGGKDPADET